MCHVDWHWLAGKSRGSLPAFWAFHFDLRGLFLFATFSKSICPSDRKAMQPIIVRNCEDEEIAHVAVSAFVGVLPMPG